MSFELNWVESAADAYAEFKLSAEKALQTRQAKKKSKVSKQEGLFRQVYKTVSLLSENPRHAGLHTHEFHSLTHPYAKGEKVFEVYAQNNTPGAYRVFWCYGPGKGEITIIAMTPHP